MVTKNNDQQTVSITLIDNDQQPIKEESYLSYRRKNRCHGKYFISIGISICIVIVITILIFLFREKNKRCGIFNKSNQCA